MSEEATLRPSPPSSLPSFLLAMTAWVVGLLALSRAAAVQEYALLPFARLQQGVAVALFGASPTAVVVDTSCTGWDAIALSLGAVLGFPAPWKRRLRGALAGLALITLLNTLRIASVSAVAADRRMFDLLHARVWPALIILAAVLYVFSWMQSVTDHAPPRGPARHGSARQGSARHGWAGLVRRTSRGMRGQARAAVAQWRPRARAAAPVTWQAAATVTLLVAAYFAALPWILRSATLQRCAAWSAAAASGVLSALGVSASLSGNMLTVGDTAWLVTPECIATPLLPIYLATVACWPCPPRRRALWLALAVPLFGALGSARLLVLALPASPEVQSVAVHAFRQLGLAAVLVGIAAGLTRSGADTRRSRLQRAAGAAALGTVAAIGYAAFTGVLSATWRSVAGALLTHQGHAYADAQGALLLLPAFQLGTFVALWAAMGQPLGRRAAGGIAALAVQQAMLIVALGELQTHAAVELPIVAIRALSLLVPVALVLALGRHHFSPALPPRGHYAVPSG